MLFLKSLIADFTPRINTYYCFCYKNLPIHFLDYERFGYLSWTSFRHLLLSFWTD